MESSNGEGVGEGVRDDVRLLVGVAESEGDGEKDKVTRGLDVVDVRFPLMLLDLKLLSESDAVHVSVVLRLSMSAPLITTSEVLTDTVVVGVTDHVELREANDDTVTVSVSVAYRVDEDDNVCVMTTPTVIVPVMDGVGGDTVSDDDSELFPHEREGVTVLVVVGGPCVRVGVILLLLTDVSREEEVELVTLLMSVSE